MMARKPGAKALKAVRKCDCQRDSHFGDATIPHTRKHAYGDEYPLSQLAPVGPPTPSGYQPVKCRACRRDCTDEAVLLRWKETGSVLVRDDRLYHLPKSVQEQYRAAGEWDAITRCATHAGGETITVRVGERRDTWRWADGAWRRTEEGR